MNKFLILIPVYGFFGLAYANGGGNTQVVSNLISLNTNGYDIADGFDSFGIRAGGNVTPNNPSASSPIALCVSGIHVRTDDGVCSLAGYTASTSYNLGNDKPELGISAFGWGNDGVVLKLFQVEIQSGDSSCDTFANGDGGKLADWWDYVIPSTLGTNLKFAAEITLEPTTSYSYYAQLTNCSLTNY